jgi:hypothetical protein
MVGAAGLEGILAARRAPAFGQTTKIHLLQWVDFIPEGDVEVRRQVAEYTKQTKVRSPSRPSTPTTSRPASLPRSSRARGRT